MRIRSLSASLALAAAATVLSTATAHAVPDNCTIGGTFPYVNSSCTSGTGEHQIVVKFQFLDPTLGWTYFVGPWAPVGGVSETRTALGGFIVAKWVAKR